MKRAQQCCHPGAQMELRGIASFSAPWTPAFECPGTTGLCGSGLQHNARASRSFLQHRWWTHTKSHPSGCLMCLCLQMKRKATMTYASALPPHPCWRRAPQVDVGDSQLQLQLCSYRSYFSPRTVVFWCSHQHRNQRAECTPDQYNFHRMDIYQPMSQEMKVKDFWIHQLLSQERSCPQSCLDSLHLCQLLFLSPPSQGYKGEALHYHPRSSVRIYLHSHTTAQSQWSCKLGWVSQQLQVSWFLLWLSCFLCWAHKIVSMWSVSLGAMHMLQVHTPSYLLTDKQKSSCSTAGFN